LWKAAGKPDDSAEKDWYRAEEIVRSAAAAWGTVDFARTLPRAVTWHRRDDIAGLSVDGPLHFPTSAPVTM